jgi:hypothetical protein
MGDSGTVRLAWLVGRGRRNSTQRRKDAEAKKGTEDKSESVEAVILAVR